MTYIEPTSELTLLKGVPLNPDYANTTHYNSPSAQYSDIVNSKYSPIALKNYTYLRTNAGAIRIEAKYLNVPIPGGSVNIKIKQATKAVAHRIIKIQ